MSCNLDYIVNSSLDPEKMVLVPESAIAGEVVARIWIVTNVHETAVVLPDGPRHAGDWSLDSQNAFLSRYDCLCHPVVGFGSAGWTPKNGSVQHSGLMGVQSASGAIRYDPVTV